MSPSNALFFTNTDIDRDLLKSIDPQAKVIILDPTQNSLEQFTSALSEYTDITSLHILSESLFSDTSVLNEAQEQQLNQSLSADASLFFYESNRETGNFQVSKQISVSDWLNTLENNSLNTAATVTTNLDDYAPGSTAVISGNNFEVGETVNLQVLHTDGTPNTGVTDTSDRTIDVVVNDGDIDSNTATSTIQSIIPTTFYELGNRVWNDENNNGSIDGSEVGIDGVTVNLLQGSSVIDTTTTTDGGYYLFADLPAGDYVVEIDSTNFDATKVLENLVSSSVDETNPNDDVDSNDNGLGINPDPTNGIRSGTITLGPGTDEPINETDLAPGGGALENNLGDGLSEGTGSDVPETYPSIQNGAFQGRDNSSSVLVGGNYTVQKGAEAEGKIVVLQDLTTVADSGFVDLGEAGVGSRIPPEDGTDFLLVGGNLIVNDSFNVGSTVLGNVRYQGTQSGTGDIITGGTITDDDVLDLSQYSNALSDLQTKSAYWATLADTANGTIDNPGYKIDFIGDGTSGLYVFNVPGTAFDPGFGKLINFINIPTNDTAIIINVTGSTAILNIGNMIAPDGTGTTGFDFNSDFAGNILWNFPNATDVTLKNAQIWGSVLVAQATSTTNMEAAGHNGRFITAGNLIQNKQGSEFHNYEFDPGTPLPLPPSTGDGNSNDPDNQANLTADFGFTSPVPAPPLLILETAVETSTTGSSSVDADVADATAPDATAGETVTYSATVQHAPGSTENAHDVVIEDLLVDTDLTLIATSVKVLLNGTVIADDTTSDSGITIDSGNTAGDNTISVTYTGSAGLAVSDVLTVEYDAVVSSTTGVHTNTATLNWDDTFGTGGVSGTQVTDDANVEILLDNIPPALDLNGSDEIGANYNTTFTGSSVNITDTDATGTDVNAPDIERLTLTIGGVTTDAATETLTIGNGTPLALNANNSATGVSVTDATSTFDIVVADNGTTLTITNNAGGNLTQADVDALLQDISYNNSAGTPVSGDRIITMVANDGIADSDPVTSTISVNNPPAIDLNDDGTTADSSFASTFSAGGDAVNITDTDADVLDSGENDITLLSISPGNIVDGTNEIITFNGNNGATASFSLDGSDTASQSLIIGNSVVSIAYNTTNAAFEIVDINSSNTVIPQEDLDALTRGITYENTLENPTSTSDRTLTFTVTDANSLTSEPAISTIAIEDISDNSGNPLVTFEAGSYVIDMGQDVQTAENTLKGYGLVYELAFNLNVPVQWSIDSEKEFFDADFTAGGKDYRGGSFIIQEDFITPEVLAIFDDARFSQVSIDQINEEFTAPIFDEITSFPKAVLDLQNGGLAIPYFENAGILPLDSSAADYNPLNEPYIMGTPEDLNDCNDVYVMPHADPDSWPESYKTTMYDFVVNQGGWLWAADHAVSALEVTDIEGFGDRFDLNFLGHDDGIEYFKGDPTGAGRYGGHSGGTLPYEYDRTIASDPEMQVMGLFIDDAITNGSEQIYIPFDADGVAGEGGWLPTTTIAGFDPDHPERFDRTLFPGSAYEAAVLAYGPAFGNEEYGNVMYSAGHSYAKGDGTANIAAQRTFFNFLLQSGRERQPQIDASEFPSEISSGSSEQLRITVDSDHGTLTNYEWQSTDGVSTFSNQTIQIDPVTGQTVITADFTLNSDSTIVTIQVNDGCGRQAIHSQVFVDPPPVVDLDGNNSTTTVNNFLGTYRGGGVATAAVDVDVAVSDDSSFIESATISLTNRPDGTEEYLVIDTTAGGTVAGIIATDNGDGGILLTGRTNQADYQKVIATLQYQNNLNAPTQEDRVIQVIVNDGISDSEPAISTLTLNNAPLANDDALITNIDETLTITDPNGGLVNNDFEIEGEGLSVSTNTDPSNGTVNVATDGTLNYAPNGSFIGTDSFEYTVVDTVGNETTATVKIYVNPTGNNPPDAVNDTGYSTPGGIALTVDAASGILDNDTYPLDSDNDTVIIDRADQYSANGGTVTVNADGSFEYTPPTSFQGTDTFTYTISDGNGGADTATVEIAVTNAPPDAVDDIYDGGFDTPLTVGVENGILNNDSDPSTPSDPFTITAYDVVSANGGTVTVNGDGSFEYTPPAGFEGTDSFTYTITETAPQTGSDTATVTIEVVRPPEAEDNYHGTDKNSSLTLDLLGNDTTSSVFDPSSVAIVPGSESWDTNSDKKPKLTINSDGTVDFGFFEGKTQFDKGTYTFDYIVADATGQTTTATVFVVVADKDDPSGVPDFATTSVDTPVTINVASNDYTENDPAGWNTLEIQADPSQGTVAIQTNDNGTPGDTSDDYPEVVYTPNAGVTGTDTFEYRVKEGDGDRTQDTLVTVDIVNLKPTAGNDAITVEEDSTDNVIDVFVNDFKGDSPDTIIAVSTPDNGTAIINNEVIEYTPNPDFNGTDIFTYTVEDVNGDSSTATVTVTVNPVNDVPVATDNSAFVEFNSFVDIKVTADDDFGGDGASTGAISITDAPSNGTAVVNSQGTPDDPTDDTIDYINNGTDADDSFTYTITDSDGDTSTATVNVKVNHPPVAEDDNYSLDTDTNPQLIVTASSGVLNNDTDIDLDALVINSFDATSANGGTVDKSNDGSFVYTPSPGFIGQDSFTYSIIDPNGDIDAATVTIDVTGTPNAGGGEPPEANSDSAVATQSINVEINVLGNDTTSGSFDPASVAVIAGTESWNTSDTKQSLSVDSVTGNFTFQSVDNGTFSFTYQVADTNGNLTSAQVNILVSGDGTGVISSPDNATTSAQTPVTINLTDNDSSPVDGWNTPEIRANPTNGNVTLQINDQGDGDPANDTVEAVYVPNAGFIGTDTFEYRAKDSNGDTLPDTVVTVTVEPLEEGDTQANNDSTVATKEVDVEINVLGNDTTSSSFDPASVEVITGTESWDTSKTDQTLTVETTTGNFTFQSADNGTFSFTYQVADTNGNLTSAQVNILVSGDGTGVISSPDNATTSAQTPVTINLTDNDSSPVDGWNTPEIRANPTNGNVTLQINDQGDGDPANDTVEAVYVPNAGFIGTDTFEYRAKDSNGDTLPDTVVTVTVEPLEAGDTQANNDSTVATKEVDVEINVLGNDTTSSSFDPASVEVITGTESWDTSKTDQTLTVEPTTGNFTFQSADNGTFSFTYQVADTNGNLTSAQVNILVSGDGTGVISSPDNATTSAQTPVTINLTDNDSSPVDGWNTPEIRANPTNGNVTLQINDQGDGDPANDTVEAVYVPNAGFIGTDTFEYRAKDSNGDTLPDTVVTVTVEPVTASPTDKPTAQDNNATVNEDSINNAISVLYDDNFGTDGASTGTINITSAPSNGTAIVNDNETPNDPTDDFIQYTPNADFNGTDQLTYQITDATGDTAEANVDITINPVNDIPDANNDSITTDENGAVNIPVVVGDGNTVIADDFGGDGASTSVDITIISDPSNGTATVNDNGTPNDPTDDSIDYTPEPGFNGIDEVIYQITDADGDTSEGIVLITVNDVDYQPVADNETAITDEEVVVNIDVTDGDDFGLDGAASGTISIATPATSGTATVNDGGTTDDPTDDTIDYSPGTDFSGTDTFEYAITDSDGDTSIGQVEVTVNGSNDPPTAIANSYTGNEDTDITGNVITDDTGEGLDSDIDGDSFTVSVNTDPANGTVTVAANGDFTYTPNLNFNGTDSFTYTIIDGDGETSSALVDLMIDPVDDLADAIDDGVVTVDENSFFNPISVLDNDLGDPDLKIKDFTQAANGFVRINNNGTPLDVTDDVLEYSPDRNYSNTDSFTYTIEDADGQTDTATVSINVNDLPNQAPVANPDAITVDAATAAEAGEDLVFNDSDPNNDPVTIKQVENFNGDIETDGEIGIIGQYGSLEWSELGTEADYELDSSNPAVQALNIGDSLTEVFNYTIQDPDGATSTTTFTITILKSNKNPIATDDTFTATDEDTVTNFTTSILANDVETDPNQTISTVQVNGEPVNVGVPFEVSSGALVTVENDNTITYDPNGGLDYLNEGETGIDVFQYSIADNNPDNLGGAGISSALVTVTALGTNDAPTVNLDPDNSNGGADDSNFQNTFTEELASAAIMDSDATVFDPDDADFATVTLTIGGLVDGSDEILNINGTPFSLDGNSSDTVTIGSTTFDVDITGGGTTVTLTNADPGLDMPRGDLQDLLRGITYRNNSDAPTSGNRTIDIIASDGNLSSTSVTSNITVQPVNDTPTITVPGSQVVSEAQPLSFGSISFGDLDSGSDSVTVTLSVANGIITLDDTVASGLVLGNIASNGTATVTVTATIDQINATITAAGGIVYQGNASFTGEDNLQIVINDQGNNGVDPSTVGLPATADAISEEAIATIPITINAIAGTPTDAIDNSYTTNEETDISGNLISDDTGTGTDSGDGTLTVTGNTEPANGSVSLDSTGNFTYTPDTDFVGTDTFTYTIQDADGDVDTATATITVNPINDTPVNTVPADQNTVENTAIVFNAANGNSISIDDIDADSNEISVILSSSNGGTFTNLGDTLGLTNSPSLNGTSITLTGSQTEINEALSGLTFTPNGAADDIITITTNDQGNIGSDPGISGDGVSEEDIDTININVIANSEINTPPVNTVPAAQTTGESALGVFQDLVFSTANSNTLSITDSEADPANDLLEVTLTATNGTLKLSTTTDLNITSGADNSATVTVQGTINNINIALEGLAYSPTATSSGSIQIQTNDLGIAGTDPSVVGLDDTGSDSDERDLDTINITTVPFENINQAPVSTVPLEQTIAENQTLVFSSANSNAIAITDLDAGSSEVQVTLAAVNGTLTALGDTSGLTSASELGTNTITLVGSQTAINIALEGLTFTPDGAGNGSIEIKTNDNGHTGVDPSTFGLPNTGDATSEEDIDTVNITVNANTPDVLIDDAIIVEGDRLIFDINLTSVSSSDTILDLIATNATAEGGSDYEISNFEYRTNGVDWIAATDGTKVTIPQGQTNIQVRVDSIADTLDEVAETFTLGVNSVVSGNINDSSDTGEGTIIDDDGNEIPKIAIDDISLEEGNNGTTQFNFTVTLDNVSTQTVTVDYATVDDAATIADNDYTSASGTVAFAPGEISKTLTIDVIGDTDVDIDETFSVKLTNPTNATLVDNKGQGTIVNDDTGLIGKIFEDFDGNGIQGFFEDGVAGVSVILTGGGDDEKISTSNDNITTNMVTGDSGIYEFSELNPVEEYQLAFNNLPANNSFTDPGSNQGNNEIDSDVDPANSTTPIFTLADKEVKTSINAGVINPESDNLIGGTASPDTIIGTDNNDTLAGFKGQDTLSGGLGNDTFFYNETSEGVDVITDFDTSSDLIDFTKILDREVDYTGTDPITDGYVVRSTLGTGTMLQIDFDLTDTVTPKDVVFLRDVSPNDFTLSNLIF